MAKDFFEDNPNWGDLGDDLDVGGKSSKGKKKTIEKEPGNGGVKNFFLKVFVEFEGDRFDFFELKSIQREKEYNEERGTLDFLIVLNKGASVKSNTPFITYRYDTFQEREEKITKLYEKLDLISMRIGGENFNV